MKKLLLAALVALALTGAAWPQHTVYVADRAPDGWPVRAAVRDWNQADGLRVVYVHRCRDRSPCIPVRERDIAGPAAGVTYRSWAGATMLGADVALDASWRSAPWRYRKNIVLHEIGHSLGLEHQPDRPRSALFPYVTTRARPTAGDLRRLEALYAS